MEPGFFESIEIEPFEKRYKSCNNRKKELFKGLGLSLPQNCWHI
jgi:hypothetical protein